MLQRRLIAIALAAAFALAGSADAQIDLPGRPRATAAPPRAAELVDVQVLADVERIAPGATFHVAVIFDIAPKWHVYWIDPGAGGAPTEIVVGAPKDLAVGPTLFPRPQAIDGPSGLSYGYEGRTVLFVPVTAPLEMTARTVALEVEVFYFVCKEICLIGQTQATITLPMATGPDPAGDAGAARATLDRYRRRVPAPLERLAGASCRLEAAATAPDRRLVITGPAAGFSTVRLFPIEGPGVRFGAAETSIEDDRFRVEVDVEVRPNNALGKPMRVRGVVGLGPETSDPAYAFDLPLETEP